MFPTATSALGLLANPPWPLDEGEVAALPSYGAQLVRMLVTLGCVLVVLVLFLKLLQRRLGRGAVADAGDAIEVLATRRIDPTTRLVLVRAGTEHILIATGGGQTVRLASGPALDPEAEERELPGRDAPELGAHGAELSRAATRWHERRPSEEANP